MYGRKVAGNQIEKDKSERRELVAEEAAQVTWPGGIWLVLHLTSNRQESVSIKIYLSICHLLNAGNGYSLNIYTLSDDTPSPSPFPSPFAPPHPPTPLDYCLYFL